MFCFNNQANAEIVTAEKVKKKVNKISGIDQDQYVRYETERKICQLKELNRLSWYSHESKVKKGKEGKNKPNLKKKTKKKTPHKTITTTNNITLPHVQIIDQFLSRTTHHKTDWMS